MAFKALKPQFDADAASRSILRAIEFYFNEGFAELKKFGDFPNGQYPVRLIAMLPRVADALVQIKGPPESWILGSIKRLKSEVVKVHFNQTMILRVTLAERLSRVLTRIFQPSEAACDLYLSLQSDSEGFIPVLTLLRHPELSFLRLDTPQGESSCISALNQCKEHIHSAVLSLSKDGNVIAMRPKKLFELFLAQVEFLFTEKNLNHDASMRKIWAKALERDGWVSLDAIFTIPYIKDMVKFQRKIVADLLRSSNKLEIGQPEGQSGDQYYLRPRSYQLDVGPIIEFSDALNDVDEEEEGTEEELDVEGDVTTAAINHLNAKNTKCESVSSNDNGVTPPPKSKFFVGEDETSESESDGEEVAALAVETQIVGSQAIWLPEVMQHSFSLMTYNVLASMYATPDAFGYADPNSLVWGKRLPKITARFNAVGASIICLQECQISVEKGSAHANHFLAYKSHLARLGYEGVSMKKTSKHGTDLGNAIFWNAAIFELVEKKRVSLYDQLVQRCEKFGEETVQFYANKKAQVALFVALKHKEKNRIVIAATTHIACCYLTPSIQIAQVAEVLSSISEFAAQFDNPAVVFCGDYNQNPQSGGYSLMTQGFLDPNHPNAIPEEQFVVFPFPDCSHPLQLRSSYAEVLGQEPVATNITDKFCDTLDYIFFNPQLRPLSVLKIPSPTECRKEKGLPDAVHPSDHLPLAVKFAFL